MIPSFGPRNGFLRTNHSAMSVYTRLDILPTWAVGSFSMCTISPLRCLLLFKIRRPFSRAREQKAPPPLILVGHSMGGLVIKRAYILGKQMATYKIVGSRICAIFFLATPHQGADIANTLKRLLALVPTSLPFVNDLVPQSPVLQAIPCPSSHQR